MVPLIVAFLATIAVDPAPLDANAEIFNRAAAFAYAHRAADACEWSAGRSYSIDLSPNGRYVEFAKWATLGAHEPAIVAAGDAHGRGKFAVDLATVGCAGLAWAPGLALLLVRNR